MYVADTAHSFPSFLVSTSQLTLLSAVVQHHKLLATMSAPKATGASLETALKRHMLRSADPTSVQIWSDNLKTSLMLYAPDIGHLLENKELPGNVAWSKNNAYRHLPSYRDVDCMRAPPEFTALVCPFGAQYGCIGRHGGYPPDDAVERLAQPRDAALTAGSGGASRGAARATGKVGNKTKSRVPDPPSSDGEESDISGSAHSSSSPAPSRGTTAQTAGASAGAGESSGAPVVPASEFDLNGWYEGDPFVVPRVWLPQSNIDGVVALQKAEASLKTLFAQGCAAMHSSLDEVLASKLDSLVLYAEARKKARPDIMFHVIINYVNLGGAGVTQKTPMSMKICLDIAELHDRKIVSYSGGGLEDFNRNFLDRVSALRIQGWDPNRTDENSSYLGMIYMAAVLNAFSTEWEFLSRHQREFSSHPGCALDKVMAIVHTWEQQRSTNTGISNRMGGAATVGVSHRGSTAGAVHKTPVEVAPKQANSSAMCIFCKQAGHWVSQCRSPELSDEIKGMLATQYSEGRKAAAAAGGGQAKQAGKPKGKPGKGAGKGNGASKAK